MIIPKKSCLKLRDYDSVENRTWIANGLRRYSWAAWTVRCARALTPSPRSCLSDSNFRNIWNLFFRFFLFLLIKIGSKMQECWNNEDATIQYKCKRFDSNGQKLPDFSCDKTCVYLFYWLLTIVYNLDVNELKTLSIFIMKTNTIKCLHTPVTLSDFRFINYFSSKLIQENSFYFFSFLSSGHVTKKTIIWFTWRHFLLNYLLKKLIDVLNFSSNLTPLRYNSQREIIGSNDFRGIILESIFSTELSVQNRVAKAFNFCWDYRIYRISHVGSWGELGQTAQNLIWHFPIFFLVKKIDLVLWLIHTQTDLAHNTHQCYMHRGPLILLNIERASNTF